MDPADTMAVPITPWEAEYGPDDSADRVVLEQYDREHLGIRRYLSFLGLDRETGEEILQESFLKLHEHLIRGGDRSNLRAWLYRVAHNMARNAQTSHHSSKTDPLPDPGTSAELREESVSPEEQLLQSEAAGRFEQALGGLPVSQRECLILRAQGMKYREIAEATNLSVSTVAEHVQRGLERLKELV